MINTSVQDKALAQIQAMHQAHWPFILPVSITQLIFPHYKHGLHESGLFGDWPEH